MAKYRYAGPGPIEVLSGGEVTRPGDIREFGQEPSWGPWDLLPDGEPGDSSPPVDRDAVAGAVKAAAPAPLAAPLAAPYLPKGM